MYLRGLVIGKLLWEKVSTQQFATPWLTGTPGSRKGGFLSRNGGEHRLDPREQRFMPGEHLAHPLGEDGRATGGDALGPRGEPVEGDFCQRCPACGPRHLGCPGTTSILSEIPRAQLKPNLG